MNPEKENFGVPKVDSSPVGIVGMEGRFFRGLTNDKTPRSRAFRIGIIIFATIFFLLPALVTASVMILNYSAFLKDPSWTALAACTAIIILYIGAWIAIVKANIKK